MQSDEFEAALTRLAEQLKARRLRLAAAESCTGGWVGKLCSDRAGSSDWFEASITTYSNEAKQVLLGVAAATLSRHGAVSEEVVLEMTAGALERLARADVAVAVSGVAGPSGGTPDKPVGMVWIAWRRRCADPVAECFRFKGGRDEVRLQAARRALTGVLDCLI